MCLIKFWNKLTDTFISKNIATISSRHPELYHYTNEGALKGIVESQTIWAKHYSFLNDSQEMLCYEKSLKKYCMKSVAVIIKKKPHIKKILSQRFGIGNEIDGITKFSSEMLRMACLGEKSEEPYVASFCSLTPKNEYEKHNGLLSQWRGYASGGGYCLVFDTQKLEALVENERDIFPGGTIEPSVLGIREVVYDDDRLYREFSRDMEHLKEFVCWLTETCFEKPDPQDFFNDEIIKKMWFEYLPSFRRCTPRCKHQGFREEREIRIVAWIFDKKYSDDLNTVKREVKEHSNEKGERFNYILLFSRPKHVPKRNILPIKRIIVGPSRDKEARAERLKAYLKSKSVDATVTISETPLV